MESVRPRDRPRARGRDTRSATENGGNGVAGVRGSSGEGGSPSEAWAKAWQVLPPVASAADRIAGQGSLTPANPGPATSRRLARLGGLLGGLLGFGFGLGLLGCDDDRPGATAADAGRHDVATAVVDAGQPDAGPPKRIFAKRFVVNVRTGPDREATRIGYLRAGAVHMATTAEPVGNEGCRGGWYRLAKTGGFVCNRRDVIAFEGRRLPERRAVQPDRDAKLPYPYGRTRRDHTPMFRYLPSPAELADPGASPSAEAAAAELAAAAAESDGTDEGAEEDPGASPPTAVPPTAVPSTAVPSTAVPSTAVPSTAMPSTAVPSTAMPGDGYDAAGVDGGVFIDAGPPTLSTLQGADDSALTRWLMKGFYVSLDREMERGPRRFFRTQSNGFIPFSDLTMVEGSDFAGTRLDTGILTLPIAYVLSSRTQSYQRRDRGGPRADETPGYHHVFAVAGEEEIQGRAYVVAGDGRLFRATEVTRIDATTDFPDGLGPFEKWIDVDLATQTLVAYEGTRPVFATLISSGRVRNENIPELNHETPTGIFRISAKHLTTTMDGDTAVDGPYSIEDVPYVMYFQLAYALHSAFWHDGFGRPRSHGCVNLAPRDAQWIFNWSEPQLPLGWHGAYPTAESPGSLLRIRGVTPRR